MRTEPKMQTKMQNMIVNLKRPLTPNPGGRGRVKSRYSVGMRLMALVTTLATTGLSVTAIPAHVEQVRRVQEANKPKPHVVYELKATTTDKLTPA